MPDTPDVDALELGKRILDIAALNGLPPSAFKEMGTLTTQLATLARKATPPVEGERTKGDWLKMLVEVECGRMSKLKAADTIAAHIEALTARNKELEAARDEWRQKYVEADERAWACEHVGIIGMEARLEEAEAMCEWLALRLGDNAVNCPELKDEDGLPCLPEPGPTDELCRAHWLAAAREAVK